MDAQVFNFKEKTNTVTLKICFRRGCTFAGELRPPTNTTKIEPPRNLMIPQYIVVFTQHVLLSYIDTV